MLATVQEKPTHIVGNAAKEVYTVEDVFAEDFKSKLNEGRVELGMPPLFNLSLWARSLYGEL